MMLAKCLAVVFLAAVAVADMPSFVPVCGRRNPNLGKCVKDSTHELRERLKAGIPELNLPPQDPLHVEQFTLSNTDSLKASAHDVTIRGLSDFETQRVDVDLIGQQFHSLTLYRKVIIDAEYDVNSKIIIPIAGRGPIHIVSDDVLSEVVMKYKLVKKDGVDYMHITSVNVSLTIKNWTAVFEPSASVDSTLVAAINEALKGAREEIFNTLKPNVEKVIAELTLDRANKVADTFTFDELFPDRE